MSGLKIYLRSRVTQNYRWGQALAASVLLTYGIIQLQVIHAPIYKPFASFAMVALLVLSMTVGNRYRRKFRQLPGSMITVAGIVLMINSWSEFTSTDLIWPVVFYTSGMASIILGLSQFLLDGKRWMSVSNRSVKLKHSIFPLKRHPWEKIHEVSVDDRDVVVFFRDGQTVRVQPERCDMQHLRSKVDAIYRSALSQNRPENHPSEILQDVFEVGH